MNREITIKEMKQRIYEANVRLPQEGLVKLTWGNVSEVNYEHNIIVIKPSGLKYSAMKPEDMVVTNLDGLAYEGQLNPSSDLKTHVILYKAFPQIRSVVHTHSQWAVVWAQARRDILAYGTTHADNFYGDVPCTRSLTSEEVDTAYEEETGNVIVETFQNRELDPLAIPAVIVPNHGPFTWGESVEKAVENSIVLDEVAKMAFAVEQLNPEVNQIEQYLLDKHYFRKHGANAYYGQK
ncbi:MAG: L-ribulose-5-phosphate 4-epimerase [Culicoidibacterales bacterium]